MQPPHDDAPDAPDAPEDAPNRSGSTDAAQQLTHFDAQGRAHMVDVSAKARTQREAVAVGRVVMRRATLRTLASGTAAKGDVLGVARIAAVMGAKRTSDLIPLCHPLALSHVGVAFGYDPQSLGADAHDDDTPATLWVKVTVRCAGPTGVEMEALTAASAAALTVYDMCKAIDRGMILGACALLHKRGGRSGDFTHPQPDLVAPPERVVWR